MKTLKRTLLLLSTILILGTYALPALAAEYTVNIITINGNALSSSNTVLLNNAADINCTLSLSGTANPNTNYTAKLTIGTAIQSVPVNGNTITFAPVPVATGNHTPTLELIRTVSGTDQVIHTRSFTIGNIPNTPGRITSQFPTDKQSGFSQEQSIIVAIDRPINTSTAANAVRLVENTANESTGSGTGGSASTSNSIVCKVNVSNSASTGTITITPTTGLKANTSYTITLAAANLRTLFGNPLLQDDVSWSFTTESGITDQNPGPGDDDFPVDHAITFKFTHEVIPSSVKSNTVYLQSYGDSGKISATVTYNTSKREVTLKPKKPLAYYVKYQVFVTNGIVDGWLQSYTGTKWEFYTEEHDDDSSMIYAKTPAPDETNIPTDQSVSFRFSTQMDEDTIDEDSVYLRRAGSSSDIDADVKYDEYTRTVTLNPDESLRINTKYTVYISSRIEDYDGERIKSDKWSFQTGDYQTSHLDNYSPTPNEDDVPLDTRITIGFDDSLNASTVKTSNIYLRRAGTTSNVKCDISYNSSNREVTLAPLEDLLPGTTYTAFITSKVADAAGNKLSAFKWSFTTEERNRQFIYRYPEMGAYQVPADIEIRAGYSVPLNAGTVNISNCSLIRYGAFYGKSSMKVPIKVKYDKENQLIIIKPAAKLAYNTQYTVQIGNRVKDYTGNFISGISWSFTTIPDPTAQGSASNPSIKLGSNYLSFNGGVQPYTKNDRTMVPFRPVLEALGAEVAWDDNEQKITTILRDNTIELFIGQKLASKNGQSIALDAAPELKNNQTMIPLRFISEALGKQVTWDDNNHTVLIQ